MNQLHMDTSHKTTLPLMCGLIMIYFSSGSHGPPLLNDVYDVHAYLVSRHGWLLFLFFF
jgi:hypothetical protein